MFFLPMNAQGTCIVYI